MEKPKISIAIPYHDSPKTAYFLSRLLNSISRQSFKDYEIVLTKGPYMAHNHNEAVLRSRGEIIKLMQMDDYFAHENSLKEIVENFKGEWMIVGCAHTKDGGELFNQHHPTVNFGMWSGNNGLGSISTLVIRNDTKMLFDESMSWVVDCDLYQRYLDKYGPPQILDEVTVVIDVGEHRLTDTMTKEVKLKEMERLSRRYIDWNYERVLKMDSDIQHNLPILRHFASQCKSVTEMGVRAMVSSWAFLDGLIENTGFLVSIDRDNPSIYGVDIDEVKRKCQEDGIDFEFVQGNTLEISIEPTDMLFIDTIHTKEQLTKELELHADKVNKFIAFHDTVSCPELIGVINNFLMQNKNWGLAYNGELSNGLVVIQKHE